MWFLLIRMQESIFAMDDPLREWDPGTKRIPKNREDQQEKRLFSPWCGQDWWTWYILWGHSPHMRCHAAARKNTARPPPSTRGPAVTSRFTIKIWAIGYEFCEGAPAAVEVTGSLWRWKTL